MMINKLCDDHAKEIMEALQNNGGYCPCSIEKSDETKCMCKDFKDKINDDSFYGRCHCGLFEKVK